MTSIQTVEVDLGPRSYDIQISSSGLDGLVDVLRPWSGRRAALVSDDNVDVLYGLEVQHELQECGIEARRIVLPAGERTKSYDQLQRLLMALLDVPIHRDGVVLALGGGVVGDLVGLAAALLRRGVPCVQLPTSLIAQVDSAVGGKTAINTPQGKNLIGVFHQPTAVYVATPWLSTLPGVEFRSGMAEVVKYALLEGEPLMEYLETHVAQINAVDPAVMADLVARCVAIKARFVEQDENEVDTRRWLNLGHTVGHAVEAASGYGGLRHGEAVAIGLAAACWLSAAEGWIGEDVVDRVRSLLQRFGLPVSVDGVQRQRVMEALVQDKKASSGGIGWVLLRGIGQPSITMRSNTTLEGDLEFLTKKGVLHWETP